MNESDVSKSPGHPEDLLLAFLEDTLEPQQKERVQTHLSTCEECSRELETLGQMMANLRSNKEILCPTPWEICEFVQTGKDPGGDLARHLLVCESCKEEAEACRVPPEKETLPADLWERIHAKLPCQAPAVPERAPEQQSLLESVREWIFSFMNFPILAAATAAAVVVVLVYSQIGPQSSLTPTTSTTAKQPEGPVLALSSVDWRGEDDKIRLMAPAPSSVKTEPLRETSSKQVIVALIMLDRQTVTFDQKRIDSLYEALKPTPGISRKWTFLTPEQVRRVVGKQADQVFDRNEAFGLLADRLGVTRAIVLTVKAVGDRFDLIGELMEVPSGKVLKSRTKTEVVGNQLAWKLRETANLLE